MDKNELKLRLNGGIGDVILARNLLDSVKNKYKSITITPNETILKTYRDNDKEYLNFITSFMKIMFKHKPYIVSSDKSYDRFSIMDGLLQGIEISNDGLYRMNDYSSILCNNKIAKFNKEYVIVTTKVRGTPFFSNYYKNHRDIFLKTLSNIINKYDVVLIGERDILPSYEYNIIGKERIYCIYDDIMNKFSDKCIDLTISGEEAKQPNINRIIEDCTIMNKAKTVITFGFGGNLILSLATAKSGLNFLGEENDPLSAYYTRMSQYQQREGIKIFKNFNNFIENIVKI